MSDAPRAADVGVVIPAYNVARYLGEALDSVLGQDPAPGSVLVLDDGSTDDTGEVARSRGDAVAVHRQDNRGIGGARNALMALVDAPWVAWLDADDLWCPQHLAHLLAGAASRPDVDLVYGRAEQFVSPELAPEAAARFQVPEGSQPGLGATYTLMRRDLFDRVGPFREDIVAGEWIDWFSRARDLGAAIVEVDQVVGRRRVHGTNTGVLKKQHYTPDFMTVVRAALARRRAREDGE